MPMLEISVRYRVERKKQQKFKTKIEKRKRNPGMKAIKKMIANHLGIGDYKLVHIFGSPKFRNVSQ